METAKLVYMCIAVALSVYVIVGIFNRNSNFNK